MSYVKQNFVDGNTLTAAELNHIEDGIEAIENNVKEIKENPAEDGKDGYSPTVSVSKSGKVTTIEFTDVNGTQVATINDGVDGAAGKDGQDGKTPIKGVDYFDGKDGAKGEKGDPFTYADFTEAQLAALKGDKGDKGDDGYTPQKNKDYFDGAKGDDGVSVTHSWNGTVLTVTSASGTSSADLKGEKGDTGSTGPKGEGMAVGNVSNIQLAEGASPQVAITKTNNTNPSGATLYDFTFKIPKGDTGASGSAGTSVTVSNVSTSTADGGNNVVTFSDGKTLTVKNGSKGSTGSAGKDGTNGSDGVGIKSVVQTTTSTADSGSNVITVTKTDNTTSTFTVKNGSKGSKGDDGTSVTVSSVSESTADGGSNVVTFSDGKTLTVKNGSKGSDGVGGNKWAGKIASFLGDSITRGKNSDKAYPEYLKELVGFSVCNSYGISGSTISNFYEAMYNRVSAIDAQSDIVFVFGGVNDFNQSKPMGEWYTLNGTTRTVNSDTSTFRGALTTLCKNLINRFPHKKKVLITPLHCHTYADNYTDSQANSQGLYLEDYVNAIKEVGQMYSIPVIDLYSESGLLPSNSTNASIYFATNDKLHPNAVGHRVIADVIMGFLDRTYPMYGEYELPEQPEQPSYTNLVPSAEERIISGDALTNYDGTGYANNYRLSSSGVVKSAPMAIATGFIPVSANDTIRIGGIQWTLTGGAYNYVCAYKSDYSFIGAVYGSEAGTYGTKIHASCTIDYNTPLTTIKLANNADIAFIRISCYNQATQDGSKLIVTKNEEITD